MGSDWFSENMIIAIGLVEQRGGGREKQVELPRCVLL